MTAPRVLVVDDHPANMKLLSFLLEDNGYEVRSAPDATAALERLRDFRPDLILMDLQLPGMDGCALTRLLRQDAANQNTVVLAVTASAMKGDEERALAAGCDGYITKPIDTRDLPALLASYLRGAKRCPRP
jgi:CheY-like chemotaxis protein